MQKKPAILYIWKSSYPWDVRVEKICTALRDSGFNVSILARCGRGQPKDEMIDGIKIIRAGCERSYFLSNPVSINPLWKNAIRQAIMSEKPDIVIPREIMLASAAADISHKYNIPVIMDMAEHYPAAMKSWKKYYDDPVRRILVHYLHLPEKTERKSVPLMDGIITVCDEQIERLNLEYGFPTKDMQVVHNTPLINERIKSAKNIDPQKIVFGHHGWMSSDKNILNLVLGFDLTAKKHKEIELLLAGDGEDFTEISHAVDNAKNNDRIHLVGRYNPEELPDILKKIDIGCLPYETNDFNQHTLHNKLFDYMANGIPLLCSDTRPFRRIINKTNAGLSEDCSNPQKIAEIIDKMLTSDIQNFSKNALMSARNKYNWDIDRDKLISFINRYID